MGSLKSLVTRAYQVLKLRSNQSSPPPVHQFPFLSTAPDTPQLPDDIKSITDMMHTLNADTIGLHRISDQISRNKIAFIEVVHNPVLTVVIIVIPPGHALPLHDHPNMTGFIKVLHGRIRVRTYSKIGASKDGQQPAFKMSESVLSRRSYPQVVTPTMGNIHSIEYERGEGYAAFLDILSPPYDDDVGCNYYSCEDGGKGNLGPCTLLETDCPKDYRTISLSYPFQ